MNNAQLLTQAQQFCSYSATHSETPELAAFWNNLRTAFMQASTDFREGKNNVYRSALISAAHYLNQDITGPEGETPTDQEDPDSE